MRMVCGRGKSRRRRQVSCGMEAGAAACTLRLSPWHHSYRLCALRPRGQGAAGHKGRGSCASPCALCFSPFSLTHCSHCYLTHSARGRPKHCRQGQARGELGGRGGAPGGQAGAAPGAARSPGFRGRCQEREQWSAARVLAGLGRSGGKEQTQNRMSGNEVWCHPAAGHHLCLRPAVCAVQAAEMIAAAAEAARGKKEEASVLHQVVGRAHGKAWDAPMQCTAAAPELNHDRMHARLHALA